ncbi:hypothetical protein Z563_03419, partial [Mycobacterium tuberculosis 2097HD]
MRSDTREEIS